MPDEQLLKEYDQYFDECERANKRPLSFNAWCNTQAPLQYEELPYHAHNHD